VTRPAVPVALVVAASLLGDTFLYTVLPVSAARLGVTPLMVGILFSVNRWIRLFTNPLAARPRYGDGVTTERSRATSASRARSASTSHERVSSPKARD